MPRLFFQVTYRRPHDVAKRVWPVMSRNAMGAVGTLWEREFKPRHFASDAGERYAYKPRSPAYLKKKERLAKLSGPARATRRVSADVGRLLVYTGATRRAVLQRHLVRAFPTRVSVQIPTPKYVQMRPYKAGRPNLGEELTRVTSDEAREMEKVYAGTLRSQIREYRTEKRIRTIGS